MGPMTKQPAAIRESNPVSSGPNPNPVRIGPRHAAQEDVPSPAVESVRRTTDAINEKVDRKRAQILADPDDLIDKFVKFAFPTIASFAAGKAFEMVWSRGTGWKPAAKGAKGAARGPLMQSILFAAFSAAVGALVSGISERGSQSLVDRRHRAAAAKAAKAAKAK